MICGEPTPKYPDGRTGTTAGYQAHRRAFERACDACREAQRVYAREHMREYRLTPNGAAAIKRAAVKGYRRDAERQKERNRAKAQERADAREQNVWERFGERIVRYGVCARPTAKYPEGRTGTQAGWQAHYQAGEEPCVECRPTAAAYQAQWRANETPAQRERRLHSAYKSRGWYQKKLEKLRDSGCGSTPKPVDSLVDRTKGILL